MAHPESRSRAWVLALALVWVLPWTVACESDGGPAGPDTVAGIEDISDADIHAAADLADLTDDQRARVREILREARIRLRELRRQVRAGLIEPEVARERARRIHAAAIEALSEILTEEQIDHLFERLGERHRDRPDLDLTDEQAAAIRTLRAELRDFVREVRRKVAAGELTAEEGRASVRAKWRETHAAICDLLTEEQAGQVRFCGG